MDKKRFEARINGRVQGVGFRFFAREKANEFGITGYVRNHLDGSVEIVAEGEEDVLKQFLEILREGPRVARVADVQVTWSAASGQYNQFFVKP